MKKKENATKHTRTFPATQKRLERMAVQHDCSVAEIVDRLSKTGDPSDPKKVAVIPVSKNLELVEKSIVIKTADVFEPAAYFKTGAGLYVWDNFRERILPGAKTTKKGSEFKLARFDLVESSTDDQIEASLPKSHLFNDSDVCAIVAELIAKQKNGESGSLVTTGYANLFYLPQCVVCVSWRAGGRGWRVCAWRRGGSRWRAGGRGFSPATGRL